LGVTLPVFEIESALLVAVRGEQARVLLKAPTGSGKSTTVPGMMVGLYGSRMSMVLKFTMSKT
jgi:HrpA-like RNA helicase